MWKPVWIFKPESIAIQWRHWFIMIPRLTKIIATLGPESATPRRIHELVRNGVNVFRLNLSHGKHSDLLQWIEWIRKTEKTLNTFAGILLDLQGPKMRVGKFKGGFIQLHRGDRVIFSTEKGMGEKGWVPVQYPRFHNDVKVGSQIFLDDGNIRVKVKKISGQRVHVVVEVGGTLSDHKGLNMPDAVIRTGALTAKDKKDLAFGLKAGIDFVALSFASSAKDIQQLRRIIKKAGKDVEVIAKIERKKAVECLEEIVQVSDGLMVARGDLGIEIPLAEVPVVQQEILRLGAKHEKIVIVATQMLESMVNNHRPTRAEVSDIAQAVAGRADAIMLSAETAVGKHPIEAVRVMDRTARTQERYHEKFRRILRLNRNMEHDLPVSQGVTYSANQLVELLNAHALLIFTITGGTARQITAPKPMVPVFTYTSSLSRARKSTLLRGVVPTLVEDSQHFLEDLHNVFQNLKKHKYLKKGQRVVITTGIPTGVPKWTNIIRVEIVP